MFKELFILSLFGETILLLLGFGIGIVFGFGLYTDIILKILGYGLILIAIWFILIFFEKTEQVGDKI